MPKRDKTAQEIALDMVTLTVINPVKGGVVLFFEDIMKDGRYLVIAIKIVDEETKLGEVVTIGVGATRDEARADIKNDLISMGYPEHEATVGECVWRAPLQ